MNSTALIIIIVLAVILAFIIWKWIKPYTIKYNTTILLTGELGSGKTLTAVKLVRILIRKARFKVAFFNKYVLPIKNKWRKHKNKKRLKHNLPPLEMLKKKRRPQLYTNIPVCLISGRIHIKKEWSCKLTKEMLLLLTKIPEGSIILIDEFPQLVNQFNWDLEQVKTIINEFITFYRHYYAGHLVITAQDSSDIVVQIRRKCNQEIWCNHMKKHLFGLFYTINMCDIILNDKIQTISTTMIEENTRKHYGLFPRKGTYDTRCFSERINNALQEPMNWQRWDKLKTNKIIRMEDYISPLDDMTTEEEKLKLLKAIRKGERTKNENQEGKN